MTDETRAQAEAALKDVEAITAKLLPEPKGELIAVDAADARRPGRDRAGARPRST